MTPSSLLRRVLLYGAAASVVIAVVGGIIAAVTGGPESVLSVVIGAAMGLVFTGLTAASILLAIKVTRMDMLNPLFFGIILGVMILKFVVFVILANVLSGVGALDPLALYLSLIVAVLGTLVTDSVAFMQSRVPYVDDRPISRKSAPESD